MQYPKWSEEELILVCDAMMHLDWKQIRASNPLATELSNLLRRRASRIHGDVGPQFRSVGSISRKSEDIRTACDDYTGTKTRGGRLDAEIWRRFVDSPEKMHWLAVEIWERYASAEQIPAPQSAPNRRLDTAFPTPNLPWGGKVDSSRWSEIGLAGELALVNLLAAAAPELSVNHVAATCDGLGYDIAVSGRAQGHLEVKSTTRQTGLTLYLSRNEYHALHRVPDWELVAVRMNSNHEPTAVATVPNDWISDQVPADRGPYGRWESCRLIVPPHIPVPGISRLGIASSADTAGRLLSGASEWVG